ncbi:MAG TPA: TadE/TadG family type IV pilus assembly protein [Dongiaceae bacterium]|nr:TadE/TadG family type IV pilus assembly protein [Dongiaceae bacterium]
MSAMLFLSDLISRLARDSRGAVAVEFAIIAPVMLVMYFGTFEASRLVRAYMATNRAAQLIANLAAAEGSDGVAAADSADFCSAGKLAMSPFPASAFKATIASATKNLSSGAVAFDWQDTTCGGGAGSFASAAAASNGLLSANGDTVIIVKVSYDYSGPIHFVLPATFNISQSAYQRPRTGNTIPHS